MTDDRDHRKKRSAPFGNPIVRDPTIEEPTPVQAIPVEPPPDMRRATAADVQRIEKAIADHSTQDSTALTEIRNELRANTLKTDQTIGHVSEVRVALAGILPRVDTLVQNAAREQAKAAAAEQATAAAHATVEVTARHARMARKWDIAFTVGKWLLAPLGAAAGLALEHWLL